MAERRMFAKTIIDSDSFLDMPLSTQALYFHLSMRADDEGFINNPKRIMRTIGAAEDDMKVLIAKRYLIPFESGVVVIRHWKIHNYIQKDRAHETQCTDEKAMLTADKTGAYCIQNGYKLDTTCIQNGYIGKESIDKESIDKESIEDARVFMAMPLKDGGEYEITVAYKEDLEKAYPMINVEADLHNMASWLNRNPSRQKTRRGMPKFITSWLDRTAASNPRTQAAAKKSFLEIAEELEAGI